jgi:hypothetical protein
MHVNLSQIIQVTLLTRGYPVCCGGISLKQMVGLKYIWIQDMWQWLKEICKVCSNEAQRYYQYRWSQLKIGRLINVYKAIRIEELELERITESQFLAFSFSIPSSLHTPLKNRTDINKHPYMFEMNLQLTTSWRFCNVKSDSELLLITSSNTNISIVFISQYWNYIAIPTECSFSIRKLVHRKLETGLTTDAIAITEKEHQKITYLLKI